MAARPNRTTPRHTTKTKSASAPKKPRTTKPQAAAKPAEAVVVMTAAPPKSRTERLQAASLVVKEPVVVAKKRPFYGNSRTDPGPGRVTRALVLAGIAVLVLAASLSATQVIAQAGGNSGTIKVHDGATADPPQRNEPHVEGDAFVEGFNMAADEGTLNIFSWPPTGNRELVVATTWEADGGEPESHFLAGPFVLPCGHYRAEAQNGMEEDDFPGGVKSKMFWVECEEPEPIPCDEPGGEPCPAEEIVCPADLSVVANGDQSITLTWTPVDGSDGTNIYRAEGDDDLEYVTTVGPGVGTYHDTDTVTGRGYAYSVTTLVGNEESEDCPIVEATAIPEFPTTVALGLASAGGLLAFVLPRRRKT